MCLAQTVALSASATRVSNLGIWWVTYLNEGLGHLLNLGEQLSLL